MARPHDRDALLILAHLEGLTPSERHALAWREGSASACVRAVVKGGVRSASARDRAVAGQVDPRSVRAALAGCGARLETPGDDGYPSSLLDLTDPPVCLFARGSLPPPGRPAVSVVGARKCTAYGREAAETLGARLAAAGVWVVSGAALGIDGAAHRGALRGGGPTIAVLGSGIDVAYPRGNAGLIERVARVGAVVSEYPPGVEPLPHRFPARNRLVAALSRGVIVVEGAAGSGSLITVEFAEDLGREVMAVPGAVTGPLSGVPHALIRDGAALIREAADVLEALGLDPPRTEARGPPEAHADLDLTEDERRLLERVPGTPATLDALATSASVDPTGALRVLGALELRGLVVAEGGRYRRTGSAARARGGVGRSGSK
ncbi:MAG: DNA-processing protein DprA [Actinomycetota bacterium]